MQPATEEGATGATGATCGKRDTRAENSMAGATRSITEEGATELGEEGTSFVAGAMIHSIQAVATRHLRRGRGTVKAGAIDIIRNA